MLAVVAGMSAIAEAAMAAWMIDLDIGNCVPEFGNPRLDAPTYRLFAIRKTACFPCVLWDAASPPIRPKV
jgi:hypothetical protein